MISPFQMTMTRSHRRTLAILDNGKQLGTDIRMESASVVLLGELSGPC